MPTGKEMVANMDKQFERMLQAWKVWGDVNRSNWDIVSVQMVEFATQGEALANKCEGQADEIDRLKQKLEEALADNSRFATKLGRRDVECLDWRTKAVDAQAALAKLQPLVNALQCERDQLRRELSILRGAILRGIDEVEPRNSTPNV